MSYDTLPKVQYVNPYLWLGILAAQRYASAAEFILALTLSGLALKSKDLFYIQQAFAQHARTQPIVIERGEN